ncbi:peptidoglycan-binding protein [Streptomyces sp. NPDC005009]
MNRRRRWAAGVAVAATLLTVSATAAAQVIKSPAQAAADSAAPPPSVLSAPVERRVLKDSVILRGTVTAEQSVQVTPTAAGEAAGRLVVTKTPVAAGASFEAGKVLLEVSGRPLIALQGGLPVYRDLRPGMRGDDVAQLQKALSRLGHSTAGDRKGYFGAGTKDALTGLYADLGYEPLPATQEGEATLSGARDAVTEAERGLQDARDALAGAEDGDKGPAKQVTRAEEDLSRARRTLADVEEASGPMLPVSEVVFLQGFPARVESLPVAVGAEVSDKALTVTAGDLVVSGVLKPHQKDLVRVGQRVEILSEITGDRYPAEVVSVADGVTPQGGGDGADAAAQPAAEPGYTMVVEPDEELDPGLAGQGVRLTVEAASTDHEVLAVPVSAVSAGVDGRTTLQVLNEDGTRRRVPVTTEATGDGWVEVRPERGRLEEGDRVVTGAGPDRAGEASE